MAITIKLKDRLKPQQELWLTKNIGPRMHYLHNSIGGQGWVCKLSDEQKIVYNHDNSRTFHARVWTLTLEDERYASFFILMFPQ